jgi:hypothetical protein
LPLEHREGEIPAQLFLGVDDPGRFRSNIPGFLKDCLSVLAWLPEVDVNSVDVISLFHQPAQDYRSI